MMALPAGKPPEPRKGGTRIFCPMIDVPATEATGTMHMCGWQPARDTTRSRARYRRHWRRDHFAPFMAETRAVMRFIQKGRWGATGTTVTAVLEVSK